MSVEIYSTIDITKKVRFQIEEKDRNVNIDKDYANIYDNYWATGSPLPKSQVTTEDQQQAVPAKNNFIRPAVVFLVLLCLILMAAVTVVLILLIQDKIVNANLTTEREKLWTDNREMNNLNAELTRQTHQLQENISEVTAERDRLQELLDNSSCPGNWVKFDNSCYLLSASKKNNKESMKSCESLDAHLVVVSSEEEQIFLNSFHNGIWIGLTDQEEEGVWKWIDGTRATKLYWRQNQPDNGYKGNEDCVEISKISSNINSWNDLQCTTSLYYMCEKMLTLTLN
ncbi:CD209 antigen-like protein E isoform X1 [Echeneis naucrates]|uniref:CD209 antigen-like protein E isoform X1 n=1 Tax=Echeneis naucrates TaxID=173247 RepID=UPI0011135BFA|nr:CD209 antigen-like protein E isoform X1 [Echeneis naucrates]